MKSALNSTMLVSSELDVDSPMRVFYRGKVVFLTGATGVLGELFVEKLLRLEDRNKFLELFYVIVNVCPL